MSSFIIHFDWVCLFSVCVYACVCTLPFLLPTCMQIVSLLVVIPIILVVIFFARGRNKNTNDDDDATDVDNTAGDNAAVYVSQTPNQGDKLEKQTDPNSVPYSNVIEMQDLSSTNS